MEDIVRNTYNKIADKYAAERDTFDNRKWLERLSEMLPEAARVLDLGCGPGLHVDEFLASKGFRLIGLDISEKQIELAKKNVPEGDYSVRDMSSLGYGEFKVNAAVSFYAVFHVPRDTQLDLFRKIFSFLPSGGGVLLVTMATTEWEGIEEDFHGEKMFESHFAPPQNTELVKAAGFEIITDEIDHAGDEDHQVILAKRP